MSNALKRVATSRLTPTTNKQRKQVKVRVRQAENILFIGSEMWYDSFWLKMMFIGAAFVGARGMRKADKQTLAYVDNGYTHLEKLALDELATEHGFRSLAIKSTSGVLALLNQDRLNFGLLDVMFFCHGVNSKITMNFWSRPNVELTTNNFLSVNAKAFLPHGRIFSYACRTGVFIDEESFDSESDAQPENSLAQLMANHFNIEVHAYLRRTFYGNVLRPASQSSSISSTLNAKRDTYERSIIQIPPDHEALPHRDLGNTNPSNRLNPFAGSKREGTVDYALWRKAGGITLPSAAQTPTGLPTNMRTYKPTQKP
jgi:hypothetical protein